MVRGVLATAVAVAVAAAAAPAAMADEYELVVSKSPADAAGTVTGTMRTSATGISREPLPVITDIVDCGEDCAETIAEYNPCGLRLCTIVWPEVSLLADPAPGWALEGWEGCTEVEKTRACVPDFKRSARGVRAVFDDVERPTVQPMGPDEGTAVRGRVDLAAGAADNWGVAQVEFLAGRLSLGVDGDPRDGWTASLDTAGMPDGPLEVSMIATDLDGQTSTATLRLVVDNGASVTIDPATPGGYVRAAPRIAFTVPADVSPAGVECRLIVRSASSPPEFTPCASPYDPGFQNDGEYAVEIQATDAVGNVATATHAFRVDSGAPQAALTAAPVENSVLTTGDAAFAFTASDPAPLTITCGMDGRFDACRDSAVYGGLTDGAHTFVLRAVDAAGNVRELERRFKVDLPEQIAQPAPPPPPPHPPIEDRPPRMLNATLFYSFGAPKARSTKLLALKLSALPRGGKVEVTCRGRCPAKRWAATVANGGVLKLKRFAPARFGRGAAIEVRLSLPGAVGTRWRLTIRASKPPKFERGCLSEAGAPAGCPGV